MRQHTMLRALAAAGLAAAAACSDQNDPAGPVGQPDLAPRGTLQGPADDPNSLARVVPGFGGFFYDAQGTPTMYLADIRARESAERALAPYLRSHGLAGGQIRIRQGARSWADLERWHSRVTPEALSLAGAVYVDADEAGNRITVGVERGAAGRIRAALSRVGLPAGALAVVEAEPVTYAVGAPKPKGATLQSRVRPIIGGVQINFPGFLCTLGFNVSASGTGSFITNSHCTNIQGGVQGTPYWQPTQSVDGTQIATEVADPSYTTGGGCPAGRRCRVSDASRAQYASGIPFTLGRIAQTARPRRSSLAITGQWSIQGEGIAAAGQTVNKVGRTTGWSQGVVTNTCVDTNVSGSDITQLCQNFVSATVGSGDSGSPVFVIGTGSNVTLVGILWGGSGSSLFVYSPIGAVHADLGSFTVR